jgi:sporulation protein YlmC with PRC-barrel domain
MQFVASALKGYDIQAEDGIIGTVSDFLFDDTTWALRWLVVDNSTWLSERRLLLHPSSIDKTKAYDRRVLPVMLTKAQIEGSPDIGHDQPVSRQMEMSLYDYYGASPLWDGGYFGAGAIASPLSSPPIYGQTPMGSPDGDRRQEDDHASHLRSIASVTGYHVHAKDGLIGHVDNFMIDDSHWTIPFIIVDTKNFWPGKHIILSPQAVTEVDWLGREIRLNLSRDKVRTSPEWDPSAFADAHFEKQPRTQYNWPNNTFY